MTQRTWQSIAKEAQEYRDASINRIEPPIPAVPKDLPLDRTDIPKYLLTTEEVVITETAPEELVTSLATSKLTSFTVTSAFLRRAGLAQALVIVARCEMSSGANINRPTASRNSFRSEPLPGPNTSMTIFPNVGSPSDRYMGSLSV